jgi:signal peptidase I
MATETTKPSATTKKSALRENVESLVWAIGLALIIRTFIIAPFKIPSGSMRPTLIERDRILVSKFTYRFQLPQRGDIVVFRYPENPKRPFIKRLVALGGDTVEIREGHLYVNGQALERLEIFRQNKYFNQGPYGQPGQVVQVPADQLFVLGDNSISSHDSRFWGFVPRKYLIGKALCIFWPVWPHYRLRVLR